MTGQGLDARGLRLDLTRVLVKLPVDLRDLRLGGDLLLDGLIRV